MSVFKHCICARFRHCNVTCTVSTHLCVVCHHFKKCGCGGGKTIEMWWQWWRETIEMWRSKKGRRQSEKVICRGKRASLPSSSLNMHGLLGKNQ